MSSIMTSTVRKVGLDHFEPDLSDDPQAQRRLRGQLEKIDYTAFAANREMIAAGLASVDVQKLQRLALAAADARVRWVSHAIAVSAEGRAPGSDQAAKLAALRTTFEELSEAYEGLRRMIERGYLSLRD